MVHSASFTGEMSGYATGKNANGVLSSLRK